MAWWLFASPPAWRRVTRMYKTCPASSSVADRRGDVGSRTIHRSSESGASHQQHRKEAAGENVERKAKPGPPHRDTRILNEQVMKEVENPVSREGGHNQPKILLEAPYGQSKESAC